jgi:multicomponent Na+:H+ antiporter subunit F
VTAVAAAAGAAFALLLGLTRLFIGPTLHDRLLAATGVAMKLAVIAAAAAVLTGQAAAVDVALALVFALLVVNLAVLKFFRAHTFQAPLARAEDA